MFFKKKETAEERERAITYKRVFRSTDGNAVYLDLMNRFWVLNRKPPQPSDFDRGRLEGQREAILYIVEMVGTDIKKLDELMKGESDE